MANLIKATRLKIQSASPQVYWREIVAVVILLLAIVFFRSERKELLAIVPQIKQANGTWLMAALVISVVCVLLQSGMYVKTFAAVQLRLKWPHAVSLFLKRNFISVFLPAGGVSALAYFPSQLRKQGFNRLQVHQASALYAFTGLLTVFIVGLPVVLYTMFGINGTANAWLGLLALLVIIVLLAGLVNTVKQKKGVYRWFERRFPDASARMHEMLPANVNRSGVVQATCLSIGVEGCGILHIYLAMLALGLPASLSASAAAYIIAVLMMVISPFLRGLGAVELFMSLILQKFGYSAPQALSITILYRVFEFWLPLVGGLGAFSWKGRKLFARMAPAVLVFMLGIINILSAITPPVHERMRLLREYLPMSSIHASNMLVLFTGLALLVTSAYLLKGLRNAWIMALGLAFFSLIGHLTKALDYEEASLAAFTMLLLIVTRSQYRIQSSRQRIKAGLKTAAISVAAVMLFGFISFYFIDKRNFGVDFTWKQSLLHTLNMFLLMEDTTLHPLTRFGNEFVWLIRATGFLTWGFLLYSLIRPGLHKHTVPENAKERVNSLLTQFGSSTMDYFKYYKDKLYFFSEIHEGFIAYRIARGFAIVLEEPVCAPENKYSILREFDQQCKKMGLHTAFYRVNESSIPWFTRLRKNRMMIGQEAILDVTRFSTEGRDKKSLRNGLNSLQKKGFTVHIETAPHDPRILQELKQVSDDWLQNFNKEEAIFSQGMFDKSELEKQDMVLLKDPEGKIKAFLNIIPDYSEEECTYDLIRKTADAPAAAMDALIIKLIEYARAHNKIYINLGMVPMSGITQPENMAERVVKLAALKIKRFQHYQGLREFKEKYASFWENKYLVYDHDFDLLQLPLALNAVMKTN
ncbi:MAG: bifunctional lysylphosphatidylglycerol flippase/synthetase MprF [Niastella sp.]|uniref:bifunctional lysylphosphatidylglycerol flippase/synthetase MprF n=1 Tax=Niastella sp. TaxID=1869183 RepID=UPI003899FC0F